MRETWICCIFKGAKGGEDKVERCGGGVTALIRINTSKSSPRPGVFCGRSQGAWIDKTHLHCSEMADWSDLKRKIPFTSTQYNLLFHILAEKGQKKGNNQPIFH